MGQKGPLGRHSRRACSCLPVVNPAVATVEEFDDWLVAQGARVLSPTELQDFVGKVRWSNVPGENPGDPDFPFGGMGSA
jgi:hypothetical protein